MDWTTTVISPPESVRDARLVARVRAGDDAALARIMAIHTPGLMAHARRIVGGHHDAEDVVQDAFVRAHKALLADDRPIALAAWLHTIVRNRALDRLRQARPQTSFEDAARLHAADCSGEPEHALARREALGELVGGLRALPLRQREAVLMHEFEGASHATIGRRLGVSEAGSKTLLHRARASMRSHVAA